MLSIANNLVIASTNKGKVKEFIHRLDGLRLHVYSLNDFSDVPNVVEDGDSFMANAEIKARIIGNALNMAALADDSGLCVQALQGEPGIYSARYAHEHATDEENVAKLLDQLNKIYKEDPSQNQIYPTHPLGYRLLSPSYYACALVLYDPSKDKYIHVEERCEGWIIDTPCGSGGFGYDPIFYLPEYKRTMAELTMEEKNAMSHRGKALDRLITQLLP